MIKNIIFAMILVCYGTHVKASDDVDELNHAFAIREIQVGDAEELHNIMSGCYKEGLPADAKAYTDNMIKRRETGNVYTCYFFDEKAAVGFGRMPVTGYKPHEHADILNQFIALGVLQKKNLDGGLEEDNLARVDNLGLGVILPMLPQTLSEIDKIAILQSALSHFVRLKEAGNMLPIENTAPHQLIGLFHPEDAILPLMEQVGFTVTKNAGFFEFYNKPRVMAHLTL